MKTPSRSKTNPNRDHRGEPRPARRPRAPAAERPGVGTKPSDATSPAIGGPSAYLYGVVRWPLPWADSAAAVSASLGAGVGDPPAGITPIVYKDLAALVSRVHAASIGSGQGVRGLRRDMRAHANVLNRLVALGGTVLPAAFGLIFPRGELLSERFLLPQYKSLAAHLARLDDAVEVTLKVALAEDVAIREAVAESPQLARATGRPAQSLDAKIELGKRVAEALRAKRRDEGRRVLNALSPVVRDVKLKESGADTVVINGSLLVSRRQLPAFDKTLAQVSRSERGRMQFDCVGPLPPYSFVDLRL